MRLGRGMRRAGTVLAVVLAVGAAPPQDGLLDAAREGDATAVRALLEDGVDPNLAQGDGLTALHLAAREGHLEVVGILIGAGAETGAATRIGDYTPLHLASGGGHADVVDALLGGGADAEAV
ncbi:MAG: ankyrin repeat domain-containing protein, partial [Gammaproteobacteria bacterium]|nr:ankyrin repeat domain-containing protein [Gammaproteobacteria bacterium]